MGLKQALMIMLVIGLGSAPLTGRAEEELFDAKAAAQHIEQGIERLNAKDYDAAIAEFEESATISPEAEAYYYLGYTYYLKGRAKDGGNRNLSRENFEKAYEIDPSFTPRRPAPAEAADIPSAAEQPGPSSPAPAPAQPAP
jgi:tetratricopeptide (TPR) repeat protein